MPDRPEGSSWDPDQYNRFAEQRELPFWDLAALLEPVAPPVVADLGCGDGRLTAALHERLGARATTGVDSSPTMLAAAAAQERAGLTFVEGDIGRWSATGVDVVFSNAALHWVPDHGAVLERWRAALNAGGQLAVQVPSNADHPSHTVSVALARQWLGDDAPPDPVAGNVLAPEHYAEILHGLGFATQHVRLQVYPHVLPSSAEVVEWVKGTSLTRFKAVLDADAFDAFVGEYRARLLAVIGDRRPYFYAFKRILFWGRLPGW
jgi:trans-aconitate 2-methyltransferase